LNADLCHAAQSATVSDLLAHQATRRESEMHEGETKMLNVLIGVAIVDGLLFAFVIGMVIEKLLTGKW
jgi:hypothetical protein